jgi:hypothetical protein
MPTVVTATKYWTPDQHLPYAPEAGLEHFNDTVIVRLPISAGAYVIIAKTVLRNFDGDSQNAAAYMMMNDGEIELDRADIRLSGNGGAQYSAQEVSLQAALLLEEPTVVDLRAQTWNGAAFQSSIIAIQVDILNN